MKKIRICIRGAAGLLGTRLASVISQIPDMEFTVGVYKNDATLKRLLALNEFGGPLHRQLPQKMYLDESQHILDVVNQKYTKHNFLPLSELDLNTECDVVVDAAASGDKNTLQKQYEKFNGPIILQDGAYPKGRLLVSPMMAKPQSGNKYRQGGCIIAGITPLLAIFADLIKRTRMHLMTQDEGRDSNIAERANTFKIANNSIPRMEIELLQLFPDMDLRIMSVIQVPGMMHYAAYLEIETVNSISVSEVYDRLQSISRIRILPDSVESTLVVGIARSIDDRIPPIMVFGNSIRVSPCGHGTLIQMNLALYYRTLLLLPNLDAIRILTEGMSPLEAMQRTDSDVGF